MRVARLKDRFLHQVGTMHAAAWLVLVGVVVWAWLFGSLGVQNHRNFGTWSYDMGIYDQALWLVSRGGDTFMSVRGLDVWGHHVNLIAYAFVPFYWLGAGPSFLYVAQACALALGGVPVYLIARDRFASPWMGLCWSVVYLLYAPVQWISWAMFHPEALVITPFLFAWWFATRERWGWYAAMLLVVLSTREDTALAVMVLGVVLLVHMRRAPDRRTVRRAALATVAVGAVWYLVCARVVLPWFNDGREPFYVTYFYGNYGSSMPEIVATMVRHPDRVVSDMVQHDRLVFYKQMSWPLGWAYLGNPLGLLMAGPQLLASVIGLSPYARMIRYQYTSVMIAPVFIASINGAYSVWRFRMARLLLPIWLLGCAYVSNVAWSPSPLNDRAYGVWSRPDPRHESLRRALALLPDGASVTASYQLLPHLSHRREVYDWPNPFWAAVWGNDDCYRLPDPTTVDWVVLDLSQVGANNQTLFDAMTAPDGPFETVFRDDAVILLHRTGTTPEVDERPQRDSCLELERRHATR